MNSNDAGVANRDSERSLATTHAEGLVVDGLTVEIDGTRLLNEVSFGIAPGERLGLIGGSGSGKTLTTLAIMGLLPRRAVATGSIRLGDTDILGLPERDLAPLRGDRMGMIFQEPKTALSPYRKLGNQMTHALTRHYELSRAERREAALRLADEVALEDPERILNSYPHEVSGGQRQRAAIAAALSANPGLLLADEPTTALDVAVQRGVLNQLRDLAGARACSLLFVTHDLAVMAEVAERVIVLDHGHVVETGSIDQILRAPRHETTKSLIRAAAENEGAT